MIYTGLTKKALNVCYECHAGQYDKGGVPYCFHPYEVAESMTDEVSTCVALLHDVVEDTDMTLDRLRVIGFPDEVIRAVDAMTHRPGESYGEYLSRVKQNPVAVRVKIADLTHNMDRTRLDDPNDCKKYQAYASALESLSANSVS